MARPKQLNGGRPLMVIDETILKKLCQLHLTQKVMADILECSVDTLNRNYADKMELWQSESKSKIASVLFDEAINKREPWALKALAQKHLDYSDKSEVRAEINIGLADKMAKARVRSGKE